MALAMVGLIISANPIVRVIRKNRFFGSDSFKQLRAELRAVVREHNDVVAYVGEIRSRGSFELGSSSTGQHAHLATSSNTSEWNYKRDRNAKVYAPHVHNSSLQVVRNAQGEPIKYLMKYFAIKADQSTLADVQRVADDIARLESAVANVKAREVTIQNRVNPPDFILKYYSAEFWSQVGVKLSPIEVPYPLYTFQYVSAGGNSSQTTDIVMNTPTLEAVSAALVERIRWASSAAGQRSLMTSKLREQIKRRDNFSCLRCHISVKAEPHLLLEIDHIHPVSRGGLSVPENLQTLCWKCNRTKGARTSPPSDPAAPSGVQPVAFLPTPRKTLEVPAAQATITASKGTARDARVEVRVEPPAAITESPSRDLARDRTPLSRPAPGRDARAPISNPDQPRFAVLDIETSGLSPDTGRIVEIAIVTTNPYGRVLDEWSTKVNPQGSAGPTHIHGIRPEDLTTAPVFHDVIAQVTHRLAGAALVAHNAKFELSFLRAEYERAGWNLPTVPQLCTLEASTYYLPQLDRRRLADCCWAVGTPLVDAHTALGDARATAVLLAAFMHPNWGPAPTAHHASLPLEAQRVAWPSGPVREPIDSSSPPAPDGFSWSIPTPATPALASLLDRLSLADALEEGAPQGAVSYLEMLAEALEDGELSDAESKQLASAADAMGLTEEDVMATNQAFVLALAHEAAADGRVSRVERLELLAVASLLHLDPRVVPALLDRAELCREKKLGENLRPLPVDWSLGAPLRVGDRIVFTGCEAFNRPELEARAVNGGVRVLGSLSTKVDMLVSDGTIAGTKAATADYLGTRIVHPQEFLVLLEHLQPAVPRQARVIPKPRLAPAVTQGVQTASSAGPEPISIPEGLTPVQIREWGRDNGWQVGSRGRLNQRLIAAYVEAH